MRTYLFSLRWVPKATLSNSTWCLCMVAVALLCFAPSAQACPTCKAGLGAHDPTHGDLATAYMWSILFMMSMPFTMLASFSGYMYYLVRKARTSAGSSALETQPTYSQPALASAEASEPEVVHA